MLRRRVNKLGWMAGAALITLTLATAPARADHRQADIIVPVVTAFALGALWNHGYHEHYYRHGYRYQRHGYRHHGYKRKGHYRHGQHRYKHRYSSSRGGYYGSKHRH